MSERIVYTFYESPWAELLIASSARGLCLVQFDTSLARARAALASRWGRCSWVESRRENCAVLAALRDYFRGHSQQFHLPLDLRGTPFQLAVWRALRRIPYGETRSYKQLALAAARPRAFRAVGMACHANRIPIIIPCHRVLGSDGSLGGFGGGLTLKRQLLAHEQRFAHRHD